LVLPGLLVACSAENAADGVGGKSGVAPEGGICLMNNCRSDAECGGCIDNRVTCLLEENRCVACDPNTGAGCPEGETCTGYGICAPTGQTCVTDDRGEPQVGCMQDKDCAACDPMHQVCSEGRCQGCTESNTVHCLNSDVCVDGACSAKCPDSCSSDADCGECGRGGNDAHACNDHKCSECSETVPCADGKSCQAGSCVAGCGVGGPEPGACASDADCVNCGERSSGGFSCHMPLNDDHGTCVAEAQGCSDLGDGVAVLPEPWSDITNLCSNDADCSGVGIAFNVGELIRDAIGDDSIDLGFTEIEINDAIIDYDMNRCADVELTGELSCGVCVPCKVDNDCQPIGLDPLMADLFKSDPLASMAAAFLLDFLFGDNANHDINFYCQDVAAGYGVCAPCSNPFQACGQNQASSGGNGSCDHSPCAQGDALGSSCSSCVADICADDPYCCDTAWDAQCVSAVPAYCGAGACVGDGAGSCSHSECGAGGPLDSSCSNCAQTVCLADPYCCDTEWDSICVEMVPEYCGSDACIGDGGSCAHSECSEGSALAPSCSGCASIVCQNDPYCCDTEWDDICLEEVAEFCGESACYGGGSCTHDSCSLGGPLSPSCGGCETTICAQDPYCCETEWDEQCVEEVTTFCGASCDNGSCDHGLCSIGSPLSGSCSSCTAAVCDADPYCCDEQWDAQCVDEVNEICGSGTCYTCEHSECVDGEALDYTCSSCADVVCASDSFCCTDEWDSQCVEEAAYACGCW
jgi:hypothetical protein